ncbi:MAG: hypothetical protein MUO43_04750 [Desulfobacterales bacterium]|nr:hypothetical protein [Desulfobacterales bacterium]
MWPNRFEKKLSKRFAISAILVSILFYVLLIPANCSVAVSGDGGDYSKAQEFPEREFANNLLQYNHVLVKLSSDIDICMVTSRNGSHIDILAEKLGIKPIISNRKYSNYCIAFSPNNLELKQMAKELDKNDDKVISLNELSEIY